jgi:hypothetical protein
MIWGADMPADDWRRISAKEVARRAIQRIEAKGKGVLLLHDIHERTVEALPIILKELKERGFRIVHVVPSSADQPATPTVASDWKLHPQQATQKVAALPKNAMIDVSSAGVTTLKDRSEDNLGPARPRRHGRHFVARERHHASHRHHRHVSRDRYAPRDRHAAR